MTTSYPKRINDSEAIYAIYNLKTTQFQLVIILF